MKKIKCSQCGAQIFLESKLEKIAFCRYCCSSMVVENQAESSSSLIKSMQAFRLKTQVYLPLSFEQYQYDEGVRTEWLVTGQQNNRFFLTQDDENYSLVAVCDCQIDQSLNWYSLLPHSQVNIEDKSWLVTEKRLLTNSCNQQLRYSYLTAQNAELLVLIFAGSSVQCRHGFWLDPFEINHDN